ncbi:MAG: PadR family transcriptional regulator [Candidatus Heimdallarchaeota archaeon]|nr:MAG: PadR family transcriptional regulator [Candidatus Heimdallarchaeota archaeon]
MDSTDKLVEKWIQGFHRGSLRFFILHLLRHEREDKNITQTGENLFRKKIHGYHIAKAIKEITEEKWEPTTASIYPILNQFEKERIIEEIAEGNNKEGKRFTKKYRLTDYGLEVAQKLEQARKDFAKAFRIHPRHIPPPQSHLQMIKSKLDLSDEEISEILASASLRDLKIEKKQLEESILLIQETLKAVEAEIERKKTS